MSKRGRLEIIYDILKIIKENPRGIKTTPLLRKSNLSTSRFKEYYFEIAEKGFTKELLTSGDKKLIITERGDLFLERYKIISGFINEFGL